MANANEISQCYKLEKKIISDQISILGFDNLTSGGIFFADCTVIHTVDPDPTGDFNKNTSGLKKRRNAVHQHFVVVISIKMTR